MGMYTEVFFRAELKKDTPKSVIELLAAWVKGEADTVPLPEHPFFACKRWTSLPIGGSAYFPTVAAPVFVKSLDWAEYWILSFHSSLKNYDGEAEKFFDWIGPYVAGGGREFLGYSLYEEDELPQLFFRTDATS